MSFLRFEIRHKDGRKEITNVEGERVLIGHGAHCDIRLPLDQAASEHVAVEVIGGTVRVETKAYDPPATLNGLPFTNVPLPPDVPLRIGTTWVYIALGNVAFDGGPVLQQKKGDKTSPARKVLGISVLGAGAYMMLNGDDDAVPQAPTQVPELFATAPATCPQSPDQALMFAQERNDMAEGKRERSPFAPKDGVEAVELYELVGGLLSAGRRQGPGRRGDRGGRAAPHGDHARLPRAQRSPRALDGGRRLPAREERREHPRLAHAGQRRHVGVLAAGDQSHRQATDGEAVRVRSKTMRVSFAATAGLALSLLAGGCAETPQHKAAKDLTVIRSETTPDRLQARGDASAMAGDLTRAEQYFTAALAAGGDERVLTKRLLVVCTTDERYPAAASHAEDYLRKHPGDTEVRYVLATIYLALGDRPLARGTLERVVAEEPELAVAHYALATVLRDTGDSYLDADRQFREYIRLSPQGEYAEAARASLLKSVP